MSLERRVFDLLRGRGLTVACAESLTGGLVADALVRFPGSTGHFQGGIVAYHDWAKTRFLDVDKGLLDERTAYCGEVAEAMARGARALFGAAVGLSTTGVAGPEPDQGKPVGLVHVGFAAEGQTTHREWRFAGTRDEIRRKATEAALQLLLDELG